MQGQLDIFGFWGLGVVDDSDALNAVSVVILILGPTVGRLNRFLGLVARVLRRSIVNAVLGMTAKLPGGRSSLIPVCLRALLALLVKRSMAVDRVGGLAEAHFGRYLSGGRSGRPRRRRRTRRRAISSISGVTSLAV